MTVFVLRLERTGNGKDAESYGLKSSDGFGLLSSSGSFAELRMTAGTGNGKDNSRVTAGADNGKGNSRVTAGADNGKGNSRSLTDDKQRNGQRQGQK
jgi:hypothetical protein